MAFSPIDGAASVINAPPGGPGAGPMPVGGPGLMATGKAAHKGHSKHGRSIHHGPHTSHKGKAKAGRGVNRRRGH